MSTHRYEKSSQRDDKKMGIKSLRQSIRNMESASSEQYESESSSSEDDAYRGAEEEYKFDSSEPDEIESESEHEGENKQRVEWELPEVVPVTCDIGEDETGVKKSPVNSVMDSQCQPVKKQYVNEEASVKYYSEYTQEMIFSRRKEANGSPRLIAYEEKTQRYVCSPRDASEKIITIQEELCCEHRMSSKFLRSGLCGTETDDLWEFYMKNILFYTNVSRSKMSYTSSRRYAYIFGEKGVGRLTTTVVFCSRWSYNLLYVKPYFRVKGMYLEIVKRARLLQPCIVYFDRCASIFLNPLRTGELYSALKTYDRETDDVWFSFSSSMGPNKIPAQMKSLFDMHGQVIFVGAPMDMNSRKRFFKVVYDILTRGKVFKMSKDERNKKKSRNDLMTSSGDADNAVDMMSYFSNTLWDRAIDLFIHSSEFCTYREMYEFLCSLFRRKSEECYQQWYARKIKQMFTFESSGGDTRAGSIVSSSSSSEQNAGTKKIKFPGQRERTTTVLLDAREKVRKYTSGVINGSKYGQYASQGIFDDQDQREGVTSDEISSDNLSGYAKEFQKISEREFWPTHGDLFTYITDSMPRSKHDETGYCLCTRHVKREYEAKKEEYANYLNYGNTFFQPHSIVSKYVSLRDVGICTPEIINEEKERISTLVSSLDSQAKMQRSSGAVSSSSSSSYPRSPTYKMSSMSTSSPKRSRSTSSGNYFIPERNRNQEYLRDDSPTYREDSPVYSNDYGSDPLEDYSSFNGTQGEPYIPPSGSNFTIGRETSYIDDPYGSNKNGGLLSRRKRATDYFSTQSSSPGQSEDENRETDYSFLTSPSHTMRTLPGGNSKRVDAKGKGKMGNVQIQPAYKAMRSRRDASMNSSSEGGEISDRLGSMKLNSPPPTLNLGSLNTGDLLALTQKEITRRTSSSSSSSSSSNSLSSSTGDGFFVSPKNNRRKPSRRRGGAVTATSRRISKNTNRV